MGILNQLFSIFVLFVFSFLASAPTKTGAQTYNNEYDYFFTYHLPDARSEALGQTQVTLFGNPIASFYNAASSSFNKGLNFEHGYLKTNEYREFEKSEYQSFALSYNFGKYGAAALHLQRFKFGDFHKLYVEDFDGLGIWWRSNSETSNLRLNYSYMLLDDFSFGFNVNYFEDKLYEDKKSSWLFDFGLMKRIIFDYEDIINSFVLGASVSNISNTGTSHRFKDYYNDYYTRNNYFPSIFRIGATCCFEPKKQVNDLRVFKMLLTFEYNDLLNSRYYITQKGGMELSFYEIVNLRCGIYNQDISDSEDSSSISFFTFGVGLNIPFDKISIISLPASLQLNYADYSSKSGLGSNSTILTFNLNINI